MKNILWVNRADIKLLRLLPRYKDFDATAKDPRKAVEVIRAITYEQIGTATAEDMAWRSLLAVGLFLQANDHEGWHGEVVAPMIVGYMRQADVKFSMRVYVACELTSKLMTLDIFNGVYDVQSGLERRDGIDSDGFLVQMGTVEYRSTQVQDDLDLMLALDLSTGGGKPGISSVISSNRSNKRRLKSRAPKPFEF